VAWEGARATGVRSEEDPKPHHDWVDTAKGIAIILVVLYHAIIFTVDADSGSRWSAVAATLGTFRMPLFFFTAGLFAAKAIGLPFRGLFATRVARLLWLYLLWSVIWTAAFTAFPAIRPDGGPTALESLVTLPFLPNANTWFVYALALYFVLAWALRRLPVWAQLVPAAVVTVLFETNMLQSGDGTLDKMATYFTFFVVAVRSGPLALRLAAHVRLVHAVALAATYAGGTAVAAALSLFSIPGVQLVLSCCAVAAGVSMSVVLGRLSAFRWLAALGRRTLQVYLLHFYPILAVAALLGSSADGAGPLAIALPPLLAAAAIVFSLSVHRATRRVPGLYALPPALLDRGPRARRVGP
jgi:uncharacterized membrane protein YcfT